MVGRSLVRKAVATAVAAGAAFVAVIALGAALYHALTLLVLPVAAAAITALLFALVAIVVAVIFLGRAEFEEEEEPEGLAARAFALFRDRPLMGAAAALAGGFIFLRNPALATMVAAAFTEKGGGRRR
ncbi:hypothetical protein [Brevundimonas sp.]|uniref:hypothetical protein n=1 Tax=Brevundimonas sp. TaxID=1871086 RepID=UPI003A8D4155